ncbi:fibrinogen alpha chain [Erpetoichthys calabaricus]|uniref:fibrinogen alpha chain n=1 Tax=Erpetoichthys calabaricus TaxID=27687 RepID=UPI0010A098AB|nr:fibrinogen alpha chain [Erpetoichthys calabaricus]
MTCPSGCRLEGLINREAKNFVDKVNAMCHLMERIRQKATDLTKDSQQSYAAARKYVVQNYVTNMKYFEMAEELQSRLKSLKQRAANLATKLRDQHGIIREQVQLMLQIEVDLDIKLRSCQGSCERASTYSINMATYEALEQQLLQVDKLSETHQKSDSTTVTLQRRTEQTLPTSYKTLASTRPDGVVYFEDVELLSLFLE